MELARSVLAQPEEAAAVREHGRATVLARDTYAHRMGTVLAVAEGIYGGYRDALSVSQPSRTVAEPETVFAPIDIISDGPPSLRVKLNRWSAVFEPRSGTTDEEVCHEVWRNDYRIPPEGFRGGTVLDIGGNIGAFAVLAAKAGAGQVVTVEPDPANRARLIRHLQRNGVEHTVTVLGCAVSGRADGVGRMVGEGGGARWVFDDHEGEIPCTTLENLIGQFGPFVMAKIDCEGCCFAAIDAVPVEALAQVDRIGLEWHGPDGPPGHPGAPHLAHLTGEEFGPLVTKLADAGEVLTFGHPRRGGLIHWKRYGA
jgi:FkbM family methyltransferase